MKIKILLLSACIVLCCSCEKEEPKDHTATITLYATIGEQNEGVSRATTDETGTYIAFKDNDKLGLFAVGPLRQNTASLEAVENLPFTMTNNKWENGVAKLKWDPDLNPDSQDWADVYGYFPYQEGTNGEYEIFNSNKDVLQDLLMAERTTVQYNNPAIFLTFKHRFSLIQLSLGTGLGAITDTDLIAAVMDKGISDKVKINDRGIIKLKHEDTTNGGINEFHPIKKGTSYYIIIPCEKFDSDSDSIAFTDIRINDVYAALEYPIVPQPNTKYNLTIHKKSEGSVTVELGDIELWGNNTNIGSVREEAGLYWATDLVNLIKAYNQNSGKDNKSLERYGTWNEDKQYWEFSLMRNLDMKDVESSRGSMINEFRGVFDGRGYTITGLDINGPGFFGTINNGSEVKDLTLKDVAVNGSGENTGALAGIVEEGATIHNCNVEGTSIVVGNGNTGGLIGSCDGTVTRSTTSADVKNGTEDNTGGLIGHLGSNGTISNSQAISNVTSEGNNAGGLVGYSEGTISDSYAACKVNGADNVGGLVGKTTALITNCYSVGRVEGNEYVGGIAGHTTALIQKSVTDGTVKGNNAVGGIAGYSESGIKESSTRATVSGEGVIGGLVGEATNDTYLTNCYATNQLPLTGNTTEAQITYSYEIGNGEGNPDDGYFCISLDSDEATINDILAKLNGDPPQWTLGKIIIGDKEYSLPVLINK